MAKENWSLVNRLKRVVNKVRFLLKFSMERWRLSSMICAAAGGHRRLSFNGGSGLRACCEEIESEDSCSSRRIHRTISYSSEDDIDKRAEIFIANFRRQLVMERQISLQLRYRRGDSFDSASP